MMINQPQQLPFVLNEQLEFPDVELALTEPNGLVAISGDLSPERLLLAYSKGIFPWYSEPDPILWWSPNPRAVLFIDDLKVSRSLKKSIRNKNYDVWINREFSGVINACAEVRKSTGTWITDQMLNAYQNLHEIGAAHCVSVYHEDNLVGGLYGVSLGKFFFGESMFSTQSDASKIALYHLVEYLKSNEFILIDCQVPNPHLESLGSIEIPRKDFIQQLEKHIKWKQPTNLWSEQLLSNNAQSNY